ncbi:RTA1 like protein-domain-containing protein [Dactylonectria estremocensis]|uniref:RTA1 like protein-domain-containing protein n=1 Tax=Dactylonectria estremocensis TaxID=1079267 RepID=A0A9P9ERH4_9HYPO|nr:RTA1 like protein-domain-containing protein [Dactylonectria estremocensis]
MVALNLLFRPGRIAAAAIFGIMTLGHLFRMFHHRIWLCIPIVVGGIFEIVGYGARAVTYSNTDKVIPYVVQSPRILLAPILFAASLYMTLSRIIRAIDDGSYSPIAPRCFLIQSMGGRLMTNTNSGSSNVKPGSNVIMGALLFHILVFGVFVVVAMVLNMRFSQSTLYMLSVTLWLVMINNKFRVVEYAMGHDGYLLSVEWGVYVFDFLWQYSNKLKPALKGDAFLQAEHLSGNSDQEMQQR